MERRSVHRSTGTMLTWTAAFLATGGLVGWGMQSYAGLDLKFVGATTVFVDLLLLSLTRDVPALYGSVLEACDHASDQLRENWTSFVDERLREFEASMLVQYALLLAGALTLGIALPNQVPLPPFLQKAVENTAVGSAVAGGIALACLPSMIRILAAPRRVIILRSAVVKEITEERKLLGESETAKEKARSAAQVLSLVER